MNTKLDLSYLEEITGGSLEVMHEMLVLFQNETPSQISILQERASNEDWEGVRAEAHKIKPTFQYLGLNNIYKSVLELEVVAKEKKKDQINELVALIETQFLVIQTDLQENITKLASGL